MKRTISLVLLIILIMSVFAGCNNNSNEVVESTKDEINDGKTQPYKSYVQNLMDTMYSDDGEFGQGSLYDINKDGTDELILMIARTDLDDAGNRYQKEYVYTVCTISDGELVPLIEEEFYLNIAGGPNAHVVVMSNEEETLLAFNSSNGGTANMEIYSLNKTTLTLEYDIEKHLDIWDEGTGDYAIINGEKNDASKVDELFANYEQEILMGWDVDDDKLFENFIKEL